MTEANLIDLAKTLVTGGTALGVALIARRVGRVEKRVTPNGTSGLSPEEAKGVSMFDELQLVGRDAKKACEQSREGLERIAKVDGKVDVLAQVLTAHVNKTNGGARL